MSRTQRPNFFNFLNICVKNIMIKSLHKVRLIYCFLLFPIFFFFIYNYYYIIINPLTVWFSSINSKHLLRCEGQGIPHAFLLRTKSGVNYEGGHWFHIAENFMARHSVMLENNLFSNSTSDVYFLLDDGMYHEV